jgi:hypothetical protein
MWNREDAKIPRPVSQGYPFFVVLRVLLAQAVLKFLILLPQPP